MSDDPYFDIAPPRATPSRAPDKPALAQGDGWRVERQEGGLWLFYISPSHQGDERAILVTAADAAALAAGTRSLDDVLIAHRAS